VLIQLSIRFSEPWGETPTKMTDEERLHKNGLCDLFMKEGIDGLQDNAAVIRALRLTDLSVELGREDSRSCVLAWIDALEKKGIGPENAIRLDFCKANAIAGERYGTQWRWDQSTLARELFHLRRAVSHPAFPQCSDTVKCLCLTNLGNRLRYAGRFIEALDCWRRVLDVQPNFGMALCNRARVFAVYAEALEDDGKRALFLWAAHREASAALAPTAIYTDVRDGQTREDTKALKEQIESLVDLEGMAALDPLAWEDASATEEERDYRRWCLFNCLYLNPSNDLGRYAVAAHDHAGLAGHVVRVDSPHIFESFFYQMVQEYVSARWLLYEGSGVRASHFSDREVSIPATEPLPSLSLAVEKLKAAYRSSYSLFDKVGFFVSAYMGLGVPERRVSFRTLWYPGGKGPIRREFDVTGNWGFCALYWLAKDLFEKENDEVAEPQARGLSDIRNHIEHKYLRVTAAETATVPLDDLALMVSRAQFESKAMHILRLARSALIYLGIGVGFEERRRQPGRIGVSIEELPPTPYLADADRA